MGESVAPAALQMASETQRFGSTPNPIECGYEHCTALSCRSPGILQARPTVSAYLSPAAGRQQDHALVDALAQLRWADLGNACMVQRAGRRGVCLSRSTSGSRGSPATRPGSLSQGPGQGSRDRHERVEGADGCVLHGLWHTRSAVAHRDALARSLAVRLDVCVRWACSVKSCCLARRHGPLPHAARVDLAAMRVINPHD
ncbi:hypothetical protein B0I37DRAFT_384087 [Chaetomium sp. MPI-CAGE-AT-0009]|nr:hypothetical protein B0I37DRAFT_384087 [Chaetomium sp. MPI-CAGE-AT-0009]